ncbi:retrovirus-related pol polyprotein from transposon TNT 1-94 [Tanacetum coccineum]|uniref:Retrovirus-related pol polyprotein from transposon TNT 1-94 n=1 Tax=Tanacetum coccineum TaxID=301880 RepID=A0ABQ4ZF12_9ASTR
MKDKVVPNTSHVKFKKTEVEEHPRISSISNQTKSVTACNDSLNSRNLNVNAVCATCGKCMFNANHDACVSKFLKDVNARTKKPNGVPISTRKPKSQANKSVATPHKKTVASESTITNSKSYYRMLYKKTNTLGSSFYVPRMKKTPEGIKWTFHDDPKKSSSPVISVRTDRGTEFLNKTLNAFFKEEGIEHQTSTPRTPEQNGVVERRNRTLVEAARMMLSASKLPLFFWAEAIATACYTQNRSIIIPAHEKMAYHIINDRKPSIKHPFTSLVDLYLTFRCVYNRDMVDSLNPSISDLMRNKRVRDVCAKTLQASFPKRTKASDYENPEPRPRKSTKCFPSADT